MLVFFFFFKWNSGFFSSSPRGPYETIKEIRVHLLKVDLSKGNVIARAVKK